MKVTPKKFLNNELEEFLFKRKTTTHKGNSGKVLIIGGSVEFHGAPVLSALAVLRTGADLAVILAPSHVADAMRKKDPNLIVKEYSGDYFNDHGVEVFKKIYKNYDSFLIGPGLGKQAKKESLIQILKLLKGKKFVVDADVFNVLEKTDIPEPYCATPHSLEFRKFYNSEFSSDVCILKKGAVDIISYKNKKAENYTGNTGMTAGGTGDVLAGCFTALLANTSDFFKAGCAAAYLTGSAGDLAYKEFGNQLIATDVINFLPKAIKNLNS